METDGIGIRGLMRTHFFRATGFSTAPSAGDFIRHGALITRPSTVAAVSIVTSIRRPKAGARARITDPLLIMAMAFATERVMAEGRSRGIRDEVSLTQAGTGEAASMAEVSVAVAPTAVDSMAEGSAAVASTAAEAGFTAAAVSVVAAITRMQSCLAAREGWGEWTWHQLTVSALPALGAMLWPDRPCRSCFCLSGKWPCRLAKRRIGRLWAERIWLPGLDSN